MFFDDLKVEHVKSPVIQTNDYYPFGLSFNSYQRENSLTNDFKYNSKELQTELDLGWYDYQARQYDPAIGRFLAVDPAADLMRRVSPYAYAFNNPIRFTDPDGMVPEDKTKDEWEDEREEDWRAAGGSESIALKASGEGDPKPKKETDPKPKKETDATVDPLSKAVVTLYESTSPLHCSYEVLKAGLNGGHTLTAGVLSGDGDQIKSGAITVGGVALSFVPWGKVFKFGKTLFAAKGYINLASSGRTAHIIAGDVTGGGHAWFGSLKSLMNGLTGSKSMFPVTWSNGKIMHAISDVVVNNTWIQQTGKAGAALTKSGQPVRFVVEGTYQGTKIRAITTHTDIITGFLIK